MAFSRAAILTLGMSIVKRPQQITQNLEAAPEIITSSALSLASRNSVTIGPLKTSLAA
jgi:hypothetical protein